MNGSFFAPTVLQAEGRWLHGGALQALEQTGGGERPPEGAGVRIREGLKMFQGRGGHPGERPDRLFERLLIHGEVSTQQAGHVAYARSGNTTATSSSVMAPRRPIGRCHDVVTNQVVDAACSEALALEELTLHEPSKEQLAALGELRSVKRLRITHARPKSLEFLRRLGNVEELVLEYVSGFDDLSPLQDLRALRALHVENLRRVSDFSGLSGLSNLRYLSIDGTLDWKQPIRDFEFLRKLPMLEVLAFFQVITKAPYPALLPALSLRNLKRLRLLPCYLAAEEYALLEEGLTGVDGATWGPYQTFAYSHLEVPKNDVRSRLPKETIASKHPEITVCFDGTRWMADPATEWFEFTGKNAGRVKCTSETADAKCRDYQDRYAAMKKAARVLIDNGKALRSGA